MVDYERAVFISYAWGGEREDIVNEIDETLQQLGIRIVRDKRVLGYRGSIKEFMERIGRGSCVIVVISDKYLRSPNCMFELVEIADNKQFHDRVFPVVLSDANIYDPLKRIEYVKHWEAKRKELAKAMKTLDPANLQGIRDDMDQYDRIRDKISGITSILKDMNTLTPEMHRDSEFSNLYDAIIERLQESTSDVPIEFNEVAKGAEEDHKAKEEAERLVAQKAEAERIERERVEQERLALAKAELERKVKEEQLAKAEAERKAKEDSDLIAAQKATVDRLARQKAEDERLVKQKADDELDAKVKADHKAKEDANRLAVRKVEAERKAKEKGSASEIKTGPAVLDQKKPASKRVMYGIAAIVGIAIVGIAFNVLSKGGNKNTPAAEAPVKTEIIEATPIGGGGGKIAFVSDRDGNNEIYIMNADGSGATRLTNNSAVDAYPAWSPDGKLIAFQSTRDDPNPVTCDPCNWDVYVMNADGSGVTRLTNNAANDFVPAWSPDGKHITFHSTRDGNREIYIMNADGSGETRLTSNTAEDYAPKWSPDGKHIVFFSTRDDPNPDICDNICETEIYIMNTDGSGVTRLTNNSDFDEEPDWSPDGKFIAFMSTQGDPDPSKCSGDCSWNIFIMNVDGSVITPLTNNSGNNFNPAWSPDGKLIAFFSHRDDPNPITCYDSSSCNFEIYIMNADGSGVTRLTNNLAHDSVPVWQP